MFHLNAIKKVFLSESNNLWHTLHKLQHSHIRFNYLIAVCYSQESKTGGTQNQSVNNCVGAVI